MTHVHVAAVKSIKIVMVHNALTLPNSGVFLRNTLIEVNGMELVEIRNELNKIASRVEDFRGSL